jgi:hypothetical protein
VEVELELVLDQVVAEVVELVVTELHSLEEQN